VEPESDSVLSVAREVARLSTNPAGRRPRADAERNRRRVLDAARSLLAERGVQVQHAEVARAAGVGVGTVYRHFPTRQALVEAAAEQRFDEILGYARTASGADPGGGLARYLHHVGEVLAADRGLSAAVEAARGTATSEPRGDTRTRLEEAVRALVTAGQEAGTLAADTTVGDVYLLVGALSAVIRTGAGDWRRFLAIALAGLRPR
jgi:AcrR family transcriptional regulator